jgi:hypothetical protein
LPAGSTVVASVAWRTAHGVRRETRVLSPGWHAVWLNMR